MPFSYATVSTILHLCLHNPQCYTYILHLCCHYLHRPDSLPLPHPLPAAPLRPDFPFLLSYATEDLGRRVPLSRLFAFLPGVSHCHSGRATARHRIWPLMLRVLVSQDTRNRVNSGSWYAVSFLFWAQCSLGIICLPVPLSVDRFCSIGKTAPSKSTWSQYDGL